ncbi:hypothetical protein Tco_0926329 [Tanacetum coccineum]|uniref:Uncharacterized protein n=1 Tax=Tanacetum coccineum TaxID=301880 RepID=A0ABQ5D9H6_9ASTR
MVEKVSFTYLLDEVGVCSILGPETIQEPTEKIIPDQAKDGKDRDRQKSYAELKRKPMNSKSGIKKGVLEMLLDKLDLPYED